MGPPNDGFEKEPPLVTILHVQVALHPAASKWFSLRFPPFLFFVIFGVPDFETTHLQFSYSTFFWVVGVA